MREIACLDDSNRRDALRRRKWNGLDYVDVGHDQTELCVHFIAGIPDLGPDNFVIRGGTRITGIRVIGLNPPSLHHGQTDTCISLRVDRAGDFSPYTICVVKTDDTGQPLDEPPDGFDPYYSCVEFSFKANCPTGLDCADATPCAPDDRRDPEISYLAKDFASFRQLMLDRLSLIMPEWRERHIPDVGIALIEVLAYVGDYLSYYQDAVATEAYIDTARLRTSIRRHARLVNYRMHEGSNARVWLFLETSTDTTLETNRLAFATNWSGATNVLDPINVEELSRVQSDQYVLFEPLAPAPRIELFAAHNLIPIYTWGNEQCCIARGATRLTLADEWVAADSYSKKEKKERKLRLVPGDFLLFEELLCATTGVAAGADRTHRHVVRLTEVDRDEDPVLERPIVRVGWAEEDALPFPLCVSAIGPAPECPLLQGISIARGNIIVADHGRHLPDEPLGTVAPRSLDLRCESVGDLEERTFRGARFRPMLQRGPVTWRQALDDDAPAARMLVNDPRGAVPQVSLVAIPPAPRDPIFEPSHLEDPQPLAARIKGGSDRIARTLRKHLSPETIDLVDTWDGISELSGNARTELLQDLRRLAVEGVPPEPLFDADDLGDPTGLAHRLRAASDAGAKSMRARLPEDTLAMIDKFDGTLSGDLRTALSELLQASLETWEARADLLDSTGDDRHFVVEVDDDGRAHLRFGDGDTGREPEPGTAFLAHYRIRNGSSGNVGAESISRVLLAGELSGATIRVRNPLPAAGGIQPEPAEEVRAMAPTAFRRNRQRAVIAADYAELAGLDRGSRRNREIQKAAAHLAWSGSWPVASISIDPTGATMSGQALRDRVFALLHRYRRMGHDLMVGDARYVPLELELDVCVAPHYPRGDVKQALLEVFSSRALPGGHRGFFHPDNLTFGDDVYISRIVASAQAVEGVSSVAVKKLRRLFTNANPDFDDGLLRIAPLEIARLDNDPSHPENGFLTITLGGGR